MRDADGERHLTAAGVTVQQVGLRVRIEQRMVLVLSVDRHQVATELAQLGRARVASVNPGGAALSQLAFEHERCASGLEDALDQGPLRSVPDLVGAPTSAQRET